jgi:hypothetical protein
MESFKVASERMANTGAGLEGLEYERFQDYIVHKVCRYYFELLPILQDRPNVTLWYTNYDDDSSTKSVSMRMGRISSSRDINLSSSDGDSELGIEEVTVVHVKKGHKDVEDKDANAISTECSSSSSDTVMNKSSTDTDNSKDLDNNANKRKKTTMKSKENTKLSPIMAKQFKKNLFKDKTRQINAKKKRNKNKVDDESDEEEHEYMVEQRKIKMKFELEKYNQSKVEHSEKMEIEKKRLEMETKEMKLRIADTKNKLILNRVEIFKARLAFKEKDPTISEEFLDIHFPLN